MWGKKNRNMKTEKYDPKQRHLILPTEEALPIMHCAPTLTHFSLSRLAAPLSPCANSEPPGSKVTASGVRLMGEAISSR